MKSPEPLPWERRSKGVSSLPGGYDSYLNSLHEVCKFVAKSAPSPSELKDWFKETFEVTPKTVESRYSFLVKVDFINSTGDICRVGDAASEWFATGDVTLLVAQLHSRTCFIGEMLAVLDQPMSVKQLLQVANDRFGCGWAGDRQITTRQGWLQSAGMIRQLEDKRLVITDAGCALLNQLSLYEPAT